MDDVFSICQLAYQFKSALLDGKTLEADRLYGQIESRFVENGMFRDVYDEAILFDVVHALKKYYEEDFPNELIPLEDHLLIVHDLHRKLQAVLDATISIESLLYEKLTHWPQLDEELSFVLDQDVEKRLQQIRSGGVTQQTLEQFFAVFFEQVEVKEDAQLSVIESAIKQSIVSFARLGQSSVRGLFLVGSEGEVSEITIKASSKSNNHPTTRFLHNVDADMTNAAEKALSCAMDIESSVSSYDYEVEISRTYMNYGGNSIGLALGVGYIAEARNLSISPYIAFTGHLEFKTGRVRSVHGVAEKLKAATQSGIHEVFISNEDLELIPDDIPITIHPVEHLREVISQLVNRVHETAEPSLEARIKKAVLLLQKQGFKQTARNEKKDHVQLIFWNGQQVPVSVYHTHRFVVGGSDKKLGQLKMVVKQAFDEVFGYVIPQSSIDNKNFTHESRNWTVDIPEVQLRERVKAFLTGLEGTSFKEAPHCDYQARVIQGRSKINVNQYNSGKLVIQGKDDPLFQKVEDELKRLLHITDIENIPQKTEQTRLEQQQAAVHAVEVGDEWVGTDESGKGDYFGPLVSAAVYVTQEIADTLSEIGVMDSKKLTDKRVIELAPRIEEICGQRCTKVIVNPKKYNELYDTFQLEGKNLNSLLAWTHIRALENILPNFEPSLPLTVLIDKFADEDYIQTRFKAEKLITGSKKVDLRLVQLPKAEVNVAVAAASIVARYYFLQQLRKLSQTYGMDLPKGASDPNIIVIGKKILGQYGSAELANIAKVHFKTTGRILGE